MKNAIGIDLGGTNIKACLMNQQGKSLKETKVATKSRDFDLVCDQIFELVLELRKSSEVETVGVCLAIPGGILEDRRTVSQSPNFPGWHNVDIVDALAKRGLHQVLVENDANLAALGEFSLLNDAKDLFFFTLGTGVGGGIILNHQLWTGAAGMAGELGHITVYPKGLHCGCGNQGCLEQYASATAIVRHGRLALERGLTPILSKMVQADLSRVNPELMARAAREGDQGCIYAFQRSGRALGIVVASLINTLNVLVYRFGGGLSAALDLIQPSIEAEIKMRAFREPGKRTSIGGAQLGNRAGMLGAAKYVFQRFEPEGKFVEFPARF